MLTLESLFPILNLTTPSHDDEFCLFGESDNKVYFVSKLDTTIIIYDNLNVNLLTFIDNVLVDKRRLLRKSDTIVKQKDLEFLQRAYQNDCCTHFSKDISKKIRHFMKYVRYYDLRIFDYPSIYNDTKFILIHDEGNKIQYKSIVRDNEIYFNNPKKEHFPIRHPLFVNKFKFRGYEEYISLDGKVVTVFQTYSRIIESHYYPEQRCYVIDGKMGIDGYNFDVEGAYSFFKKIENVDYDESFMFDFIFETELINEPSEAFLKELLELSILNPDTNLTLDCIKVYEIAII